MEDADIIVASSPVDAGISCWNLSTGEEYLRRRGCASPSHGLICVGQRFLASSQVREPSSTSGSILFWSWNKPQAEVRSFPAEAIKPLVSNTEGTYIVGGGAGGNIFLWEVATGKLLSKWRAHYRSVTNLAWLDGQTLLVSGSEDGNVKVWSMFLMFDEQRKEEAKHLYEHSFSEHTLSVTDIVCGYGGASAIIVSASEDHTCKVWSISRGVLLRNITFPTIIDAVALDPGEEVFYAGGRDGKIYIAALSAESNSDSSYGKHIIASLPDYGKAVRCLAIDSKGSLMISGSEDGIIRVWDTRTRNIVRILKHAKGPVNNIVVVKQFGTSLIPVLKRQGSRRQTLVLPPSLEKFASEDSVSKTVVSLPSSDEPSDISYSEHMIAKHVAELQQQTSSYAANMELEKLKQDYKKSVQMMEQLKKINENLYQFCVDEVLAGDKPEASLTNAM